MSGLSISTGSIVAGPRPGLLGDVTALHGRTYATGWDFPLAFECKVSAEMAAFLARYDPARDLVLSVADGGGRVVGSVTLDAGDPALAAGDTHLRWFIVVPELAGQGLGGRMLARVVAFARDSGARSIHLTTFRGLEAARTVYERAGFRLVAECEGETWGRRVHEQRWELGLG